MSKRYQEIDCDECDPEFRLDQGGLQCFACHGTGKVTKDTWTGKIAIKPYRPQQKEE